MDDDAELLKRYTVDRSEGAFTELVHRHFNLVYFAALRRANGDAQLAEEVTQAVFTSLAREARTLRGHQVLAGWLHVATRHAAANAMRTEKRRRRRETEAHIMQELLTSPAGAIDWNLLRPEIDAAIDRLNPSDRNAVLLRFFEQRTLAEVGSSLQISENAARMRVDRALDKLRVHLARRGITSTGIALASALGHQAMASAPTGLATAVANSALISVGTTASGTLSLLQLMTTTKMATGVTILATLVTLGLTLRERAAARSADREFILQKEEFESAARRLQEEQVRSGAVAQDLGAMQSTLGGLVGEDSAREGSVSRPTAGLRPRTRSARTKEQLSANSTFLSTNPAARQAFSNWLKGLTNLRYGPLFLTLGLSPEKIDALDGLIMQRGTFVYGEVLTLNPNPPTQAELSGSIRGLLGDEAFQQFQDYSSTPVTARLVTDGLAGNLYNTAEPLTPDQADRLTQLLATNSPVGPGAAGHPEDLNWATVLTQAKGLLTPAQLETFKDEAQLLSTGSGFHSVYPGSIGNTPVPPPSGLDIPPPKQ